MFGDDKELRICPSITALNVLCTVASYNKEAAQFVEEHFIKKVSLINLTIVIDWIAIIEIVLISTSKRDPV